MDRCVETTKLMEVECLGKVDDAVVELQNWETLDKEQRKKHLQLLYRYYRSLRKVANLLPISKNTVWRYMNKKLIKTHT